MNLGVNWHELGRAMALVIVLEGVLPFLSPGAAQAAMRKFVEKDPAQLRIIGLLSMLAGCWILYSLRD